MKLIITFFALLLGACVAVGAIGLIAFAAAIIPYIVYNIGLASVFHWPRVTFVQMICIVWAIGIVARLLSTIFSRPPKA